MPTPDQPDLRLQAAAYGRAIRSGSVIDARRVVRQLRQSGTPTATIFDRVFAPALVEVGDHWADGRLSVTAEHVATSITVMQIGALTRPARRGASAPLAILAGVEGEQHVVALHMIGALLEEAGWQVALVGASVPRTDLVAYVGERRPRAICLSVGLADHAPALGPLVADLVAAAPGAAVLVGGRSAGAALTPDLRPLFAPSVSDALQRLRTVAEEASVG